mmetsp:Transcript_14204/g.18539  ORF Transcript_14204/g.18539 Transcript_14204/m.18539 type:complete len:413 (+) Transcript_14204:118-1356(+)
MEAPQQQRRILGLLNPNQTRPPSTTTKTSTSKPSSGHHEGSTTAGGISIISQSKKIVDEEKTELSSREIFETICKATTGDEWSLVEDFEFVRNLGAGAAATVYLAKEKRSGYHVALKIQESVTHADFEIEMHQRFNHPNIVHMFDSFEVPGAVEIQQFHKPENSAALLEALLEEEEDPKEYLVMILEYCNQGSLFDTFCKGQNGYLSEPEAAHYFRGALDALEYIHKEFNLIHCDCKTPNLLVHNKQIKLCDFGMTVSKEDKEISGGSPIYMAPEHLKAWKTGWADDFDQASDIYSLGIVLYEILAGCFPYEVIHDDEDLEDLHELGFFDQVDEFGEKDIFNTNPVLDLRDLDDQTSDEHWVIPSPVYPPHFSAEAQDLISRLIEPCIEKRISIAEAKNHAWFQTFSSTLAT